MLYIAHTLLALGIVGILFASYQAWRICKVKELHIITPNE